MSYFNNPDLRLQKSIRFDEFGLPILEDVHAVVTDIKPTWSILPTDLSITQLTGGITNKLFLVKNNTLTQGEHTIIVRLYGDGTDMIISRDVENSVFAQLSKLNIGPSFLGIFLNGRVEQFISHSHALTEEEMRSAVISLSIAPAVAHLHSQKIQLADMKEVIFQTLYKFCNICEDQAQSNHKGKFVSELDVDKLSKLEWMKSSVTSGELRREVEWLQKHLKDAVPTAYETVTVFNCAISSSTHGDAYWRTLGRQLAFELVFSHNDLLCGNILMGTATDASKITLIDYEYAGYNPSAFDIANHFCEYAGIEMYDPNSQQTSWPSFEHRTIFMSNYLRERMAIYQQSGAHSELMEVCSRIMETPEGFRAICAGADEIVCKYAMAAHLMWGLWGLIQTSMSSIDFDYLSFAKWRIQDGYYYQKSLQASK